MCSYRTAVVCLSHSCGDPIISALCLYGQHLASLWRESVSNCLPMTVPHCLQRGLYALETFLKPTFCSAITHSAFWKMFNLKPWWSVSLTLIMCLFVEKLICSDSFCCFGFGYTALNYIRIMSQPKTKWKLNVFNNVLHNIKINMKERNNHLFLLYLTN